VEHSSPGGEARRTTNRLPKRWPASSETNTPFFAHLASFGKRAKPPCRILTRDIECLDSPNATITLNAHIMPNIASVLKEEICRLAKKEVKAQVGKTQKAAAQYRRDIAKLKRQVTQLDKEIKLLKKRNEQPGQPKADRNEMDGMRFSARSVKAQRQRLGLSAADYGKLIGVSSLTIYNWEQGKARPRKAQFAALIAVRGIGKREALAKLAETGAAKKTR
jgi:DNA-binding transcriptional regulator YiaG